MSKSLPTGRQANVKGMSKLKIQKEKLLILTPT
jgi:hypothetical protein